MAHKRKRKIKTWTDENGVTHVQLDQTSIRNEFHFNTQLKNTMQVVESKKHKKPKHKKKIFENE